LTVVVAILAVVVSLVTVGVQRARATADRLGCANNLHLIGVAAHQYQLTNKVFPTESGDNPSLYKSLAPYVYGANAADSTPIKEYLCPARRTIAEVGAKRDFGYAASYAFDTRGVSIFDSPVGVSLSAIGRGPSNTFLLTTLWMDPKDYIKGDPTDIGWAAKLNSRIYGAVAKQDSDPTGSIHHLGGPFSSDLPVLFADGHVEWVAYLAYAERWSYLPTGPDGKPITPGGPTVVTITIPTNFYRVEFDSGPGVDEFEGNPPAPEK
jgi:prepilin-type processing-associated H-X9-DG protein